MLLKLPNGNYIDPVTITGLSLLPAANGISGRHPWRVRIDRQMALLEIVDFEDEDSATAFMEELAQQHQLAFRNHTPGTASGNTPAP